MERDLFFFLYSHSNSEQDPMWIRSQGEANSVLSPGTCTGTVHVHVLYLLCSDALRPAPPAGLHHTLESARRPPRTHPMPLAARASREPAPHRNHTEHISQAAQRHPRACTTHPAHTVQEWKRDARATVPAGRPRGHLTRGDCTLASHHAFRCSTPKALPLAARTTCSCTMYSCLRPTSQSQ